MKGVEETAIIGAFLAAYKQLYQSNSTITNDFLETIEFELSDETIQKKWKKITRSLQDVQKKEEKFVTMRLEKQISEDVYQSKYREIVTEKNGYMNKNSMWR